MGKSDIKKDILAVLFTIYIVLSSHSIYVIVFSIASYVQMFFLIICFVIFMFYYIKHRINKRCLAEPLIVFFLLMLVSLINGQGVSSSFGYFIRYAVLYLALSVFVEQGVDIMKALYRAIFILMCINLFFYVFFDIMFPELGYSACYTSSLDFSGETHRASYNSHFNIYFRISTSYAVFGVKLPRVSGFCWEPGQYQIYLNYVLMYLLFFYEGRRKWFKVILTLLAVVTTTSTMGLLISIILLAFCVLNLKSRIKIPLFISACMVGIYFAYLLVNEKQEIGNISYVARTTEFELLNSIFLQNNPLGEATRLRSMANGIIRFLWDYGYVAVALIAVLIYYMTKKNYFFRSKRQKISFLIWLILSLVNEPIEYMNMTFFAVSLISLGYVFRNVNNSESRVSKEVVRCEARE